METIDLTPSWDDAMRMYMNMYEAMGQKGKDAAKEEIIRCGKIAQMYMDVQNKIFKKIDWKMLKSQKLDVLNTIEDLEIEAKEAGSAGEEALRDRYLKQSESLAGIIGLLDGLQDFAVDVLGADEKDVMLSEDE